MPISDDFRIGMWREVLALSKVQPNETVIVLTGESSHPLNIDAAMRSAHSFGASVFRLDLPPLSPKGFKGSDRTLNVGTTPLSGQHVALGVLQKADMIIDLMGLLHSPEQLSILNAGVRMLMVVEPPDILAKMIPVQEDKNRVMAADDRLRKAREMHVTSKAGTDLRMKLGQFGTLPEYGFADEKGHWDHWPSGFTSTWPNEKSANGRVVIDVGDMLLPFKMYVSSPITLEIRDGFIRSIEGGFEAKFLRQHMESYGDEGAFGVSHVGWGLQPRAQWTGLGMRDKAQSLCMDARAYYGNFLFSTGPNSEAGGSNNSACHVDIPMGHCSVSLDGEPMTIDGDVVAADQRVAKAA
ncbi:MAG: 2,5-dihydroxypyridine 5,6-dioxygenase [Pseudorhodoplanes sp.]|uniref:2,5-dihydroxypyridine 5,6-dioxygenase n=1 Tax=Pseudorhodoplanes sp. TaxID=1934341 RepID=UPI003D110257